MASRVICISRARGALGEQVGTLVASQLGYRYIDEEIISQAAARENVDPGALADAERRKSFVTRLLTQFAAAGASAYVAPLPVDDEDHYRELIREAIAETAAQGDAVIVSHAASYALVGQDDLLRVFVTASPAVRGRRLAEAGEVAEADAGKEIERSDGNRADYLKRFYDVDRELPTHYDVVVNTDRLTAEQAAALVAHAATD